MPISESSTIALRGPPEKLGLSLTQVYKKVHFQQQNCICDSKPATYAHNGKERFSSPIDSSINKLTNCHNTNATS